MERQTCNCSKPEGALRIQGCGIFFTIIMMHICKLKQAYNRLIKTMIIWVDTNYKP